MYEVELKVPADHAAVRAVLRDAGVTPGPARAQADTYYDAPHRDFAATDEALRLRRTAPLEGEGDMAAIPSGRLGAVVETAVADATAAMTYKGPLVDDRSKSREELETDLSDGATAGAILDRLGFEAVATVAKLRSAVTVDEDTITLDRVAGLGSYVEVEREVETEAEVPAAREALIARLHELGLAPGESIQTSYLELLLEASDHPD
ncbi:MAG: class IV adenylate cyclase [Halobacteriaceae archaeon]